MLSTSTPHRHSPAWLTGENAPVYLLRSGSVIERAQVEAELSGQYGAGRVFAWALLEAFADGVKTLMPDEEDGEELIALARRQADPEGEDLTAAEQQQIDGARRILAEHWAPYRDLRAQQSLRREIAPIVALRRFLVGWENVDAKFERDAMGRVTEATLARMDPLEMLDAGNAAYALLYPDERELAGNSPQASPSDANQPASTSDVSSKAAGRSTAAIGKRTRSPRSPKKPSP